MTWRPSILLSFFFWGRADLADVLGPFPERPVVFADSGGFSAASVGASIDLDDYAAWLDANREWIDVACTLDVVGDAPATLANTRRLEEHGHRVLPVFHVGEPWEFMEDYCAHYSYVGVGGMVPWSMQPAKVLRWLIRCFEIAAAHGTVIHGLGQTNIKTLAALPFYSVDSSSWVSAERYGECQFWDEQRAKLLALHGIRDRVEILERGELVRAHGLDPVWLTTPIHSAKGDAWHPPTGQGEGVSLARASSLRAWIKLADWWAARHGEVACDGMPPGPRIFYVCLDTRQVTTVLEVTIEQTRSCDAAAAPA